MRQWSARAGQPLGRCLTLSSGALAALLIPLAAAPAAARLYGARSFESPALLSSALAVTGTAACGRMESALMLSDTAKTASRRFALCRAVCAAVSAALAPVCILFSFQGAWFFLLPIGTLLTGWYAAEQAFALTRGAERAAAAANVLRAGCGAVLQFALYPLGGERALLFSPLLSYAAGIGLLALSRERTDAYSAQMLLEEARGLSGFWKQLLPGALAMQAALNLQSFVLSARQDGILAAWWMVNRLFAVLLAVISSPAGQIFSRELAVTRPSDRKRLFRSFSFVLGALAVAAALGTVLFSPLLLFLLGPGWEKTPALIRLLLPLFTVRMVVSPLSNAAVAQGRCRAVLIWQVSLLGMSILCAALPLGGFDYLICTQTALCAGYLVFYFYCRALLRREQV